MLLTINVTFRKWFIIRDYKKAVRTIAFMSLLEKQHWARFYCFLFWFLFQENTSKVTSLNILTPGSLPSLQHAPFYENTMHPTTPLTMGILYSDIPVQNFHGTKMPWICFKDSKELFCYFTNKQSSSILSL